MKQKLYQTTEGKILFAGIALSILLLLLIGYYAFIDIGISRTLVLAFFAHAIGGRSAGIGLCIMNNFSSTATIVYNFYLEILIVFICYAVFVLTTTRYIRISWLIRTMDNLAGKAAEQKDKIEAYGWIGIFLFVMAPLPFTGPVMGSIIAYLIRMSVFRNFTASLSGTLAAILVWFYCFDFLEQRFGMIQYIFGAIVVLVLLARYKSIIRFFSGKEI